MEGSQELVLPAEPRALDRKPIIDLVDRQQLQLIKATVAKDASDAEVGMFLELAAHYELDPFAKEIWCAKGRGQNGAPGRLLIMVGRDGLRKIAARQGLQIDGDVVRENDEFSVRRLPSGERVVEHGYGGGDKQRGEIIGAWCEVRAPRRRGLVSAAPGQPGHVLGFFFAPLDEYLPTSEAKLKHSPWGSQRSVMILAAAERQALRQATPLSGLLVEGEMARNEELIEGLPAEQSLSEAVVEWAPNEEVAHQLVRTLLRADEVGHVGLSDYATLEMTLRGQPVDRVQDWLADADKELSKLEREAAVGEAEESAVEEASEETPPGEEPSDDEETASSPSELPPEQDDEVESLKAQAKAKVAEAAKAGNAGEDEKAERLWDEAEELAARADSLKGEQQGALEVE